MKGRKSGKSFQNVCSPFPAVSTYLCWLSLTVKDKYGSDYDEEEDIEDSEDSEDDTTEDEDGEELTPAVDAAILRTLARIKKKDPAIYDSQKSIFQGMSMSW